MELRGSHLILLVTFVFPSTMFVTFTLSVVFDHVYPIMPFISYTGDLPFESCIFSLCLNFVAVVYIFIMNLRYNQLIKYCEEDNVTHVNTILRLNKNSFPWGLVAVLGLSVTGSFQEVYVATVHRLGALVCTYSGFVYMWYQTVESDLVVGRLNSKRVAFLRTGLSIASTTIHIVAPVAVAVLDLTYPKHHLDTLKWKMDEDGWRLHVCCSLMEWSIFFINNIYIASFYTEFKSIKIRRNEILFDWETRHHNHQDEMGPSRSKKHQ